MISFDGVPSLIVVLSEYEICSGVTTLIKEREREKVREGREGES